MGCCRFGLVEMGGGGGVGVELANKCLFFFHASHVCKRERKKQQEKKRQHE